MDYTISSPFPNSPTTTFSPASSFSLGRLLLLHLDLLLLLLSPSLHLLYLCLPQTPLPLGLGLQGRPLEVNLPPCLLSVLSGHGRPEGEPDQPSQPGEHRAEYDDEDDDGPYRYRLMIPASGRVEAACVPHRAWVVGSGFFQTPSSASCIEAPGRCRSGRRHHRGDRGDDRSDIGS